MKRFYLKLALLLFIGALCFGGLADRALAADQGQRSTAADERLATPTLKSKVTATGSGPRVSWKSVSGASGYAVYRRAEGGKWKMLGTTKSTSYTDESSLKNGKTYYYRVRAYRGKKATALEHKYSARYWSSRDETGVSFTYLKAPTIKCADRTAGKVEVTWKSVTGATGYAVYRKASGGSWKMLASTKSTSYTDKTVVSGKKYYYAVRAYRGSRTRAMANLKNAKYWSGYNKTGTTTQNPVTVIVGDSIMSGMYASSYNGLSKISISGKKYAVAKGSLNCKTMRTQVNFDGKTGVQKIASYNPTRVYIMLGMNEVTWKSTDNITQDYTDLVKAIKKSCPRAEVVVLALSPVTRAKANKVTGFKKVDAYNKTIKAMAKANGCLYYDYTETFKDSGGYLKASFDGGDGIHWSARAYEEFGRVISAYDASLD